MGCLVESRGLDPEVIDLDVVRADTPGSHRGVFLDSAGSSLPPVQVLDEVVNHLRREAEVKAVLGIPEQVDTYALLPLGYPATRPGALRRRPASEVTAYDRWGNTAPPPGP